MREWERPPERSGKTTIYFPATIFDSLPRARAPGVAQKEKKRKILIYFASATFSVLVMWLAPMCQPSDMVLSLLLWSFWPTEKCFYYYCPFRSWIVAIVRCLPSLVVAWHPNGTQMAIERSSWHTTVAATASTFFGAQHAHLPDLVAVCRLPFANRTQNPASCYLSRVASVRMPSTNHRMERMEWREKKTKRKYCRNSATRIYSTEWIPVYPLGTDA